MKRYFKLKRKSSSFDLSIVMIQVTTILTEDEYSYPDPLDYLGIDSKEEPLDYDRLVYRVGPRWRDMVERYTKRVLTYSSDKHPALAGLVSYFDSTLGDAESKLPQYLAGLWRQNLIEDLCWYSHNFFNNSSRPTQIYRAPSWSWTSVDGAVCHGALGNFEDLAQVEDVSVKCSGLNPYGEVSSGWLRLRAPCLLVTSKLRQGYDHLNSELSQRLDRLPSKIVVRSHGNDYVSDDIQFWDSPDDYRSNDIDDKIFHFVALAWSSKLSNGYFTESRVVGLLLESFLGDWKNGISSAVYRRIGLAEFTGACAFELKALKENRYSHSHLGLIVVS